MKNKFYQIKSV